MAEGRIGWQRLIVITAIGTTAVITADKLGIVNAIAKRIKLWQSMVAWDHQR